MTGELLPKDWHAAPIAIKGRLYIQFKEGGRWKQKRTGLTDTPEHLIEARAWAAETERVIKAREGLTAVAHGSGAKTLRAYAKTWLAGREGTSAVDDAQRLNQYVLPILGDLPLGAISRPMVKALVKGLRKKPSRKGGLLAPRTIHNIYGVLQSLCADAMNDGLIPYTPCTLRGRDLPQKRDKDPTFRDESLFPLPEVLQIVGNEIVPWDRRVFYAIMFLGCARFGEASELRWKDYDATLRPRGKIKVLRSYNTRHKLIKETKAERPRHVPVVRLLAKILAEWKLRGWPEQYGRAPMPNDLIVPSRGGPSGTAKGAVVRESTNRSVNLMLRRFHADLIRLGLTAVDELGDASGRQRRQHDARRTWFSNVMAAGANELHARWTAWGPKHDLWAEYTSLPWPTLCAVVDGLEEAIVEAQKAGQHG